MPNPHPAPARDSASGPSPSSSRRRWIPRAILAASALLAILALAFLWFPRGPGPKEEFEAALAELKSRGFAVTTDHLWTPCPDEDNAWFEWIALFRPAASRPNPFAPSDPRLVPPEDLLVSLAQSPASLAPADKDRLRDYFSATSDTLATFESLATKKRLVNPDNQGRPLHAWNAPRLTGVTKPFRTHLAARALMAIEDADRDTAIHLDLVALQFSRLPGTDSTYVGASEGVVLRGIALAQVSQTLRTFPIPEDQARALFDALDPAEFKEQALRSFDRQRLWQMEVCRAYFNGGRDVVGVSLGDGFMNLDDFLLRRSLADDAAMIQLRWADILTAARRPYWEARFILRTITKEINTLSEYHVAAKIFLEPYGILERAARLEARSTVLRIALACRIHAARTGTPPAALDALIPEFFPSIPLDPFTGKPFPYRLTPEGGFIVSSVGPNGLDETTAASLALAASMQTTTTLTNAGAKSSATARASSAATGDDFHYEEKPRAAHEPPPTNTD